MPSNTKLHEIYAERMMKRHDYGYALYEPALNKEIAPGRCGYIDDYGKWNPVVDLTAKDDELSKRGLAPLEVELEKAPVDKSIQWGPKFSESVSGQRIGLQAGVSAESFGVPASAACIYQFAVDSNFGAVLMTEPNIWREGYYHDSPFQAWVKKNSQKLLQLRPEIKTHGLWVVKWTYSTKSCSLNAWTDKNKQVTLGFQASAVNIGEAAPHGTWYQSTLDGGWIGSSATGKNERRVVFMGGLFFRFHRLARTGNHLQPVTRSGSSMTFRGGEDTQSFPVEVDGEAFEVSCESVGKAADMVAEPDEDEEVF